MFSDCDNDSLGFSSNWKTLSASEETSVQTINIGAEEKSVQTKTSKPVEVQTDDEEPLIATVNYDEAKLGAFLSRVCPSVMKELDRVSRSNAFRLDVRAAESIQDVREIMNVPAEEDDLRVTDLSWNCSGSVLAVALSHLQHSSWCNHRSYVKLYNTDRENQSLICTLAATACVRSISMHPYVACLVAAGTYSGEILLWDTSVEDSGKSLVCDSLVSHGDMVTQVRWILGLGTDVTLATCSLDGQLILWKVSQKLGSFQVIVRFSYESEAGITTFAFPPHQTEKFVAALEGGVLLLCSTKSNKPGKVLHTNDGIKDPVVSSFEPLPATISALEFSPHHDDIFASSSTDQAIRIYSLYQSCAQRVIWGDGPILGLGWSPSQANIIAAWGHSTHVAIFNSATGNSLKDLSPSNSDSNINISVGIFNFKSPQLLAIGGRDGSSRVWKLPYDLHA